MRTIGESHNDLGQQHGHERFFFVFLLASFHLNSIILVNHNNGILHDWFDILFHFLHLLYLRRKSKPYGKVRSVRKE